LPQWKSIKRSGVLSDREALVLELRIGLVSDVAIATSQIAHRLGCSERTIADLERSAYGKIRARLHVEGFPS
jgi:DNA-directed RNA polymerase sigma subunit (sigma70/sigma32)